MSWAEAKFVLDLNDGRRVEGFATGEILPPENTAGEEIDNFQYDAWVYESDADEEGRKYFEAGLTEEQLEAIEARALEALGRN